MIKFSTTKFKYFINTSGDNIIIYKKLFLFVFYKHKSFKDLDKAIKEYGATRLSAIIYNLRDDGYIIETNMKTTKNRFGRKVSYSEYKLIN